MSDVARLVEQARELSRRTEKAPRPGGVDLAATQRLIDDGPGLLAGLADAVETLQAELDDAREHWRGAAEEANRLLPILDAANHRALHQQGEADEARARAAALQAERDQLRELLVSAEGYAIANGADLPLAGLYPEGAHQADVIERAGCYPRDARREHPGPFTLNRPPRALLDETETPS